MKISIEIANRTKKRVNLDFVKKIVRKTIIISGISISDFSVSVVFLEKGKIKKLNRKYRQKNKATDVLSFIYASGYNKKEKTLEGELALCLEIIASQAKKNKVAFQEELAFVLSHGVFHLLGMKHSGKMYELQDEIVRQLKSK